MAITALQQAITLDSTVAAYHNSLGNLYHDLKQYEAAITAYQQAIALDPSYATPHNNLGILYRARKQYEEAIAAYRRAITLDPTYASPHNNLGKVYSVLNRIDDAYDVYKRAIELDPQNRGALFGLARIARQHGEQDQKVVLLTQLRSLLPTDDFCSRACLESIAGNADAAIEALRIGLERGE